VQLVTSPTLLLNNLATGLFLVAGFSQLVAPEIFSPLAKAAYPIAFILLPADLLSLGAGFG
jgi:hypothetical protein